MERRRRAEEISLTQGTSEREDAFEGENEGRAAERFKKVAT